MQNKKGYILPLTFILIASAFALVTVILNKSIGYTRVGVIFERKEKLRTLALGVIEIAKAQVSYLPEEKKESNKTESNGQNNIKDNNLKDNKEEKKLDDDQVWLKQLLKILNKWQNIKLNYESDGVDAEIDLFITSEQGKFNLSYLEKIAEKENKQAESKPGEAQNKLKEPEKKDPKDLNTQDTKNETGQNQKSSEEKTGPLGYNDYINRTLTKELGSGIFDALRNVKSKLGRSIDDPSELTVAINKSRVSLFPKKESQSLNKPSLFEIFTVWSISGTLNPWLLSPAVSKLLDLKPNQQLDIDKVVKNFKINLEPKELDSIFVDLYSKKFSQLPKDQQQIFSTKFTASAFGALIEVKLENLVQRLYVVLELQREHNPELKNKLFSVTRLYWL